MEASRLVFVFSRDSKPRRKVAVPVPDSYTWDQFISQVKAKLKLKAVGDIYLSSSGHRVRAVSELQDIDELCVVEAAVDAVCASASGVPPSPGRTQQPSTASTSESVPPAAGTPLRQLSGVDRHRSMSVAAPASAVASTSDSLADEADHKYVRRSNPLKRSLQRLFPSLFSPGLPITSKDVQLDTGESSAGLRGSRRRRTGSKRSSLTRGNLVLLLLLLACVATMLFVFSRVTQVQQQQAGQAAQGADIAAATPAAVATADAAVAQV